MFDQCIIGQSWLMYKPWTKTLYIRVNERKMLQISLRENLRVMNGHKVAGNMISLKLTRKVTNHLYNLNICIFSSLKAIRSKWPGSYFKEILYEHLTRIIITTVITKVFPIRPVNKMMAKVIGTKNRVSRRIIFSFSSFIEEEKLREAFSVEKSKISSIAKTNRNLYL